MNTTPSLWAVRMFALGAFTATVWFCGPRAAEVLAARFGGTDAPGPTVALDRVGYLERPEWMTDDMLVSASEFLSPWLSSEVGILDEAAAKRLREGLASTPWVHSVRIERSFPDRFLLNLEMRRPCLAVHAGDGAPLCLVDEAGVMLPWSSSTLPFVRLYRQGGDTTMNVAFGERAQARRVVVAAMIASEWRTEVAPLVPECPALLEVDSTNLGERYIVGMQYPEIRVVVARSDGAPVSLAYGRPPDSPLPRVLARTKASVLEKILERHRGLRGLIAGDLRVARRWADYLQPRDPNRADPVEQWRESAPLSIPRRSKGGD